MTGSVVKIIIRYCAAQGATVIQLANHFRKSRQAIYTFIGEEDEWEGISAIEAFNLGVSAEKLLRKLKENNNEATIPFRISPRLHSAIEQRLDLQRRRFAQMREKQEQKEVRRERFVRILESLRNLAGSDSQRDEEVKETIEDDDAEYIGTKLKDKEIDENIQNLIDKKIVDLDSDDSNYYCLDNSNLEELGLNIKTDNYFIVDYKKNDVIYIEGVENSEGNTVYKLSDMK